jgi:hypothetical protein
MFNYRRKILMHSRNLCRPLPERQGQEAFETLLHSRPCASSALCPTATLRLPIFGMTKKKPNGCCWCRATRGSLLPMAAKRLLKPAIMCTFLRIAATGWCKQTRICPLFGWRCFIPIQKSKLTRRRAADSTHVRQGETTKLGYFFGLVLYRT